MKKLILLLAAAVLIPEGNVEAQTTVASFLHVCVTGSLRPCGSVIVKTTPDGGGGTLVEMWVRNEQGGPNPDQTGGSFLTQIGLTAPVVGNVTNFTTRPPDGTDGSVGRVGNPTSHWAIENGGSGGQVTLKAGTYPGKDGAIRGCDDPNGATSHYFITCDSAGYTGWVVFSFNTTEQWSANDAQVVLKYQSIGDQDISLICRTGDVGTPHECSPTVVPEPTTYVLLLTGLTGVFGMGWLRRKEQETI